MRYISLAGIVMLAGVFCIGSNFVYAEYGKMLIIGNSLTWHAPSGGADGLSWNGNWGMAASCEANDFAHRLQSKIQSDQPGALLELEHGRILDETNTMSGYESFLDNDADLIIFELGDNYRGEDTYESFQVQLEQMISDVAAGGNNPDIIILSTWGYHPYRNSMIQQAADNHNAVFINIYPISQNPLNKASTEDYCLEEWLTNGVGWHPGDRGMEAIASAIYAEIPASIPEPTTFCLLCVGAFILRRIDKRS